MKNNKTTLVSALSVVFVDLIGVGIIYPLFSTMLFDPTHPLLAQNTSPETRGAYFGILLALSPLVQFFSAPIWGTLSDNHGRKKPLQYSLLINVLGYIIAAGAVFLSSVLLLFLSRIIIGLAAGNMSIVQATVADISSKEEKTKNFGLFSMAVGSGFTLGPFFGGFLAKWGYAMPFFFALLISALNLLVVRLYFKETRLSEKPAKMKMEWAKGILQLKTAFHNTSIRAVFLTYFLHCFAWSFFFEFIPLYLIKEFAFTAPRLGVFYSLAGAFYALSAGVLIRPLVKRLKPELLFFAGNFFTAFVIFSILFLPDAAWLWPVMVLLCYTVSFVSPTATTLVSNSAAENVQGETLGILGSANSAALVLSPLFSGTFVGVFPALTIWVSSTLLLTCGLLILWAFRKRILEKL